MNEKDNHLLTVELSEEQNGNMLDGILNNLPPSPLPKAKGRAAKDEPLRKVLRSELSKERATRLEGSFGTQKQHYSLSRIKARNRKTEILWIFFGIHTANAILMIEKIRNKTAKAA